MTELTTLSGRQAVPKDVIAVLERDGGVIIEDPSLAKIARAWIG